MAVRQYIGARYVPHFVGTYDATSNYEAMDVVDNGSGTSYIAKKPVLAGTPLTDTDHWFLYGSVNGAIINLQDQINDIRVVEIPKAISEKPFYNIQDNHVAGASYADEINAAINDHDFLFFPKGLYEIDEPIKITKNVTILMHGDAEIKATASMPYMIGVNPDNLSDADLQPEPSYTAQGTIFLKPVIVGGFFNGNGLAERGLVMNTYYHSVIKDVVIVNFTDVGVVTAYNGGRGGSHSGLNNVTVKGFNANAGFELNSTDEYIADCVAINCRTGFRLYAGDFRIENCTTWLGYGAETLYEGSIAYDTKQNISSGYITNCNLDTMQTGVSIKRRTAVSINNMFVTFNNDVIDPLNHNQLAILDVDHSLDIVNGYAVNNLIDTLNFNHYFIRTTAADTIMSGLQLSNIDFVHDPTTYVTDYFVHVIPKLFSNYSTQIDSKLVKMGSQHVLYFKIIDNLTLAANQMIVGGLYDYTVFTYADTTLPVKFYNSSGNKITGVKLHTVNRQIALSNTTGSSITIAEGEYVGFFDAII